MRRRLSNFRMGNAQARRRIKATDFHYLAKFTAFASNEVKDRKLDRKQEKGM